MLSSKKRKLKHLKFTNKSLISSNKYVAKKKKNQLGEPTARQHINLQASHSHLILFDLFIFLKKKIKAKHSRLN